MASYVVDVGGRYDASGVHASRACWGVCQDDLTHTFPPSRLVSRVVLDGAVVERYKRTEVRRAVVLE